MIYVLFDGLIKRYHVYNHEDREQLVGSDDKYTWLKLEDLPDEFYGNEHSFTKEELDYSLLEDNKCLNIM